MSPREMAQAIARTIDANAVKPTSGPLAFVSATAHDNVVEILYAARDVALFAGNKANSAGTKRALVRYYCDRSRISFLNSGIVIHQVILAPDKSDRLEFTVDHLSCANLQMPKLADAASLARIAQAKGKSRKIVSS